MPIINQVVAGGGTPPTPSGKYQLLDRITDDSNNEIGSVIGFIKDANNTEFAVVALDAAYRSVGNALYSKQTVAITGLVWTANIVEALYTESSTATDNCDKILAQSVADGNWTAPCVEHCRALTFTIDNVQYAAQMPLLKEVWMIQNHVSDINNGDPTATSNPTKKAAVNANWASSSVPNDSMVWGWSGSAPQTFSSPYRNYNYGVFPILELPNAV